MSQYFFGPAAAHHHSVSLNPHTSYPSTAPTSAHAHPHTHHGHGHSHNHNHNHNHHNGRSRRAPRFGQAQGPNKTAKPARSQRESADLLHATNVRKDFEAARSFDLEDDELFCPFHLLTEDDLHSIHSSSSDRSSEISSASPDTSPLQHQLQPTPSLALPGPAHQQISALQHGAVDQLKLHQPLAQRTRNAIPIVDPNSRAASPPTSLSPSRLSQKTYAGRRW